MILYAIAVNIIQSCYQLSNSAGFTMDVQFCFISILSSSQAWASLPLGIIGSALLGLAIWEMRKNTTIMTTFIKFTYVAIILSLLAFLIMIIASEVFFWIVFTNIDHIQLCMVYPVESKLELALYCFEIFAIYDAILLVPTNWLWTNCLFFKDYCLKNGGSEEHKRSLLSTVRFSKFCFRLLAGYLILRTVLLVGFLLSYVIVDSSVYMDSYSFIIWVWCQAECVVILGMLLLGLASVCKNNTLKEILEEGDYRLMIKHYLQLIACMTLKLILSSLTLFVLKGESRLISILLGSIVGLFLPIIVILRMYRCQNSLNQSNDNSQPSDRGRKSEIRLQIN